MKRINLIIAAGIFLNLAGCSSEDTATTVETLVSATDETTSNCDPATSTCITVGVYKFEELTSEYKDTDKDLIYTVGAKCETWSRYTVEGDEDEQHSSVSHLHYNAQDASTFDGTTITWYEYGPELSQSEIDAVCALGLAGVQKIADLTNYTADKKFYVKIKTVSP